jgi:hypothetical protein
MNNGNKKYVPYDFKKDCIAPTKTFVLCLYDFCEQFLRMKEPKIALEVAEQGLRNCSWNGRKDQTISLLFHGVIAKAFIEMNEFNKAELTLERMLLYLQVACPERISILNQLGFVLWLVGRLREAEVRLLSAYNIRNVIVDKRSRLMFETCHRLAVVYIDINDQNRAAYYDKLAVDELHRLGHEHLKVGNKSQLGHIANEIKSIVDAARESGFEVSLPQCFEDQYNACFLRRFSHGSLIYSDHDADDIEREILRGMAASPGILDRENDSNNLFCNSSCYDITRGHSHDFSQRSSVPCTIQGQQIVNQIPPSAQRISRPVSRQARSESDFSPGNRSIDNSFHGNSHSGVWQSRSVADGCGEIHRDYSSGSVHLNSHNNTPHSRVRKSHSDYAIRNLSPCIGDQPSLVDYKSMMNQSFPGNSSDSSPCHNIRSSDANESPRITPTLSPTLSPVESSWPSYNNSMVNSFDISDQDQLSQSDPCGTRPVTSQRRFASDDQRRKDPIRQSWLSHSPTEVDQSSSLAPGFTSGVDEMSLDSITMYPTQCTSIRGSALEQEIQNLTFDPPQKSMGRPGVVRSLGVNPGQKLGENYLLVHDHVGPNSRGEPEPEISLLGGHSTQQFSERPTSIWSHSLQHAFSSPSETLPKEPVSSEFATNPCNGANSTHSQMFPQCNLPPPQFAPTREAGQCRCVSQSREQRMNARELERYQGKSDLQSQRIPNAQCSQSRQNPIHISNNSAYDQEQYPRQNCHVQNPGIVPDSHTRPGLFVQNHHVASESDSCTSPISASQSYKGFINPPVQPRPAEPYQSFSPLPQNEVGLLCQSLPFNQSNLPVQQMHINNALHGASPRLYYPPNTSWHPTSSQNQSEASSFGTDPGSFNTANNSDTYWQRLGWASGRLAQSAPAQYHSTPANNLSVSSSESQELLFNATSTGPGSQEQISGQNPVINEGQDDTVSLSSSAPVTRRWSFTGLLEGITELFSSSAPSRNTSKVQYI